MQYSYHGNCRCGLVSFQVALPKSLSAYPPRQCDCDFCLCNKIAYLSDPKGMATITSTLPLDTQRQGSNQADFLTCPSCKTVIAAVITVESETGEKPLIGAINANTLEDLAELQAAQTVSPKLLAADVKRERWQQLWMPVHLNH